MSERCRKVPFASVADATPILAQMMARPGQAKLHIYSCRECPWTYHIGHANHPTTNDETRRRHRRRRRQREAMSYQRWEDDGGRPAPEHHYREA